MNPALLLVLWLAGTSMLLLGILAAVFDWLPLVSAIAVAVIGAAIETAAVIVLVIDRRAARRR